jgi:hypothetical protein
MATRPARALEALTFARAARDWVNYGLGGHVEMVEATGAAQRLLDRAREFASAA